MKKEAVAGNYKVFPIGRLNIKEDRCHISVFREFKPALKCLELFSHVVVFSENKPDSGCTKTLLFSSPCYLECNRLRNLGDRNDICISVSKITFIDQDSGIIGLDYSNACDGAYVFDIKAYFPFEDRVKEIKLPDIIRNSLEWRLEADDNTTSSSQQADMVPAEKEAKEFILAQIGEIKRTDGEYQLDLSGTCRDIIKGLEGFSHLRIIWWFNRFDKEMYRKATQCNPPYENAPRTGVFASRSPVRPNPIAMTTARILGLDAQKGTIKVTELDAFDKTPIVAIKPYIPAFDRVRSFYVPDWVRHWPEWIEENSVSQVSADIGIITPEIEKIKEYIIDESPVAENKHTVCKSEHGTAGKNTADIIVSGARQNNLKNVTVTIPKNKITVITGVSGSGKSSLAFDTIYAESQRRFMDSISTAGRAIFEQLEKPEVEQITGLPPAIALEQKTISRNPRSTVGTITDIYDYVKLLFSRIGIRHCPDCGRAICPISSNEIIRLLTLLKPGAELKLRAFNSDSELLSIRVPENDETGIFRKKITECVNNGLKAGNGAIVVKVDKSEEITLQTKQMCYHCDRVFFELTSSTFSFNNPESMCPVCSGLGKKLEVDNGLIVSRPELSILDGASEWWGNLRKHRQKPNANWMKGEVLALAEEMKVDLELPWNKLPGDFRHQVLYGSEGREVRLVYENPNGRKGEIVRPVEGVVNCISRLFKENTGDTAARLSKAFMREKDCPACKGERLSPVGRLVTVAGTRFPEITVLTIEKLLDWVKALPLKLSKDELKISRQVLEELEQRLQNLVNVGVQYLTLDRAAPTLSGGEAQRLRLATQLGCGLTNLLYVLDEPSIGLHPRDQRALLYALKSLKDAGNTVLVVEHDPEIMLSADKIVDVGPGAGEYGGKIIAQGTPQDIMDNPDSETGKYLKGEKSIGSIKKSVRKPQGWISIFGARHNNLKDIDVHFPLGVLTCITGVSGSGKSSIVSRTLYPSAAGILNDSQENAGEYSRIEGLESIDKVINISQQPIGRSPRSNPATYTGVFDDIRELFASTAESKAKGYKQNRFSFNSREGQCEACGGEGRKCVQMHFMPDVWVECSICHGKRFNEETLRVKYMGKSISDVLEMDVDEALKFFKNAPKVKRMLQTLHDVGLGYIKLGQSALTLSGGEAQRIKLARELGRTDTGRTLYILDEPTTGLHFSDIRNLMSILGRITEAGNTVIVIEHNIDVMENADWIIDLGPEGGELGGYVVAEGTPEQVAEVEESYTGRVLKVQLQMNKLNQLSSRTIDLLNHSLYNKT